MDYKVIHMPRNSHKRVEYADEYVTAPSISPNRYLTWLMEKAFNFLVKRGYLVTKNRYEHTIELDTVELDLDRLDEQICKNSRAIQAVYNQQVTTLICGNAIMRDITRGADPCLSGMIRFTLDKQSRYSRRVVLDNNEVKYERIQYRNLEVVLVPWFEGILLLPLND